MPLGCRGPPDSACPTLCSGVWSLQPAQHLKPGSFCPEPFSRGPLYQWSCKHHNRSSCLWAFIIEMVYTEFQCMLIGKRLSNYNTNRKETHVFWNKFVNLNFSPDLVTLTAQLMRLCPSQILGTHPLEHDCSGLLEAHVSSVESTWGQRQPSGEVGGGCHRAPQLPSLASSTPHDVLWDWNALFSSVSL